MVGFIWGKMQCDDDDELIVVGTSIVNIFSLCPFYSEIWCCNKKAIHRDICYAVGCIRIVDLRNWL